jgi:cation diffusion facilitator family transporter
LITGLGVVYDAYRNFLTPEKLQIGYEGFSIMFLSVIINFITSRIKIYYGKKENSLTLLADGTHDKMDVLASAAVFAGLFLSKYWIYADSLLAFFIGLYIIKESFILGKEAVDSLLDVSAGEEIENRMKNVAKIQQVEILSLKTQRKGSVIMANLEIGLANDLNIEAATKISENFRKALMREIENLAYVAIQIRSHEIESSFYRPIFGKSFGWQRRSKFKEKIAQAEGRGPDGQCVCPQCGYKIPHKKGVPCATLKCPRCEINLERK